MVARAPFFDPHPFGSFFSSIWFRPLIDSLSNQQGNKKNMLKQMEVLVLPLGAGALVATSSFGSGGQLQHQLRGPELRAQRRPGARGRRCPQQRRQAAEELLGVASEGRGEICQWASAVILTPR